jgi:hypothetical protein
MSSVLSHLVRFYSRGSPASRVRNILEGKPDERLATGTRAPGFQEKERQSRPSQHGSEGMEEFFSHRTRGIDETSRMGM